MNALPPDQSRPRDDDENQETQRLIFLHIPKTAGTTLKQALIDQYGKEGVFRIDGYRIPDSIQRFRELPNDRSRSLRVFYGHMPYGLHGVVPGPSTYISLLREPVDRLVSHYYYVIRTPESALHGETVSRGLSLKDYVERGPSAHLFNNGQTRLLGGCLDNDLAPATEDTLEAAKRNLTNFAMVGLTERFDESLLILKRMFGWQWPVYTREKVGPNRPRSEDISSDAAQAIREHNQLDVELYRFAAERFEQQIEQQGPGLRRELRTFRTLNSVNRTGTVFRGRSRSASRRQTTGRPSSRWWNRLPSWWNS